MKSNKQTNFTKIDIKDLALFVHKHLEDSGIKSVLVGGARVSIYTENRYQSYDLDFVTHSDLKKIRKVLAEIGFHEKDRYFTHPECPYLIEFCTPPVAVGNEPVKDYQRIESPIGTLELLTPTDCVRDRLSHYYHGGDAQGLKQALMVARSHKVDLQDIKEWSRKEKASSKYLKFQNELHSSKKDS